MKGIHMDSKVILYCLLAMLIMALFTVAACLSNAARTNANTVQVAQQAHMATVMGRALTMHGVRYVATRESWDGRSVVCVAANAAEVTLSVEAIQFLGDK
jgi:hypothetical protein